ncbi:restriction endonuclease subunit S [Halomonas sp. H5]|uniref:restriction endonuclease subunit S n=1 Tax=Halomonas sp. H5 TaxID=3423910 RepID=UPI003D3673C5
MSFPKYPEYKNSGVEWLGEVPAHWEVKRLRYVAELNPPKAEVRSLPPESSVSFIPMEAVGDNGSLSLEQVRPISEVLAGYTYVSEGDVTIAKITPCFENGKGAVMRGLENHIGFGTTELTVMRPKAELTTSDYLYRVVSSEPFRVLGESSMYGAGGQKRVPDDFVRNFTIAWPPYEEQLLIQSFLDHETARIDAMVEQQKRLIELLKEKRQAVISHAVTKGLDPDVPMKDSGVEWLGEVPEHWELKRLKHLVSEPVQMGPFGSSLTQVLNKPDELKVYGQENYITGDFSKGNRWVNGGLFPGYEKYNLVPGDLVFTRKGSIGNCRIVPNDVQKGIIDSDSIRVRVNGALVQASFVALLAHEAWYVSQQLSSEKRGAVLGGLNSSNIATLRIALPPLNEQKKIMDTVSKRLAEMDEAICMSCDGIELLKERRSALISAAVTGKIDVRGWQADQQSEHPEVLMAAEARATYG